MKVYIKNNFAKKENTMIAKKKGLYLGLLLSLLGIGNVIQARRVAVINRTEYKATVQFGYEVNPSGHIIMPPGIIGKVKTLQATVHDLEGPMDTKKITNVSQGSVYVIRKIFNRYILLKSMEKDDLGVLRRRVK